MERIYLTDELAIHHGESAEEHYNRLYAIQLALSFELSQKRCVYCTHRSEMKCKSYHTEINKDFMYEANQCPTYEPEIPF